MTDILSCPFCGSADVFKTAASDACVACGACNALGPSEDTGDAAIAAWNTRALPAVQPVTVRLVFNNADAMPKTTVLDVSAEAVPDIMAWYGAYCSGDRYTVTVDGRNVPMDQNGEPAKAGDA